MIHFRLKSFDVPAGFTSSRLTINRFCFNANGHLFQSEMSFAHTQLALFWLRLLVQLLYLAPIESPIDAVSQSDPNQ